MINAIESSDGIFTKKQQLYDENKHDDKVKALLRPSKSLVADPRRAQSSHAWLGIVRTVCIVVHTVRRLFTGPSGLGFLADSHHYLQLAELKRYKLSKGRLSSLHIENQIYTYLSFQVRHNHFTAYCQPSPPPPPSLPFRQSCHHESTGTDYTFRPCRSSICF